MPPVVSRRSFVEKLGLGVGGILLSPIAQSLVNEAKGQPDLRKRFMVMIMGSGIHWDWVFAPPEFRGGMIDQPVMGSTSFTLPAFISPLAKYRNRLLLVDGLENQPPNGGFTHSVGFCALSCMKPPGAGSIENGSPGGITIDQFIANKISGDRYHRSVLCGLSYLNDTTNRLPVLGIVFAQGADRPEVHFENPATYYKHVFGDLAADSGGLRRLAYKKNVLLSTMRFDVGRLQGQLAGPERVKLDNYLSAVSEMETRLQASLGLTCAQATAPGAMPTYEDKLQAMTDMSTLALICGLTNVVGISAGTGNSHSTFPERWTKIGATMDLHGNESGFAPGNIRAHQFLSGMVAGVYDKLAAVNEGNGNMADSLVSLYLSENGEQHHSNKERWPLVVVGDAGSGAKLRTGGRFFRFPPKRGQQGHRGLADLFSTLATACGAPTNEFGKGGNFAAIQGPIADFLV